MIEVDELNPLFAQLILKSGHRQQIFDVASMAWSFADDDLIGPCPVTGDRGTSHDVRMGVNRGPPSYSTMFGLRSTRRPLSETPSSRNPLNMMSPKSAA